MARAAGAGAGRAKAGERVVARRRVRVRVRSDGTDEIEECMVALGWVDDWWWVVRSDQIEITGKDRLFWNMSM